jgi:hypothetical protein
MEEFHSPKIFSVFFLLKLSFPTGLWPPLIFLLSFHFCLFHNIILLESYNMYPFQISYLWVHFLSLQLNNHKYSHLYLSITNFSSLFSNFNLSEMYSSWCWDLSAFLCMESIHFAFYLKGILSSYRHLRWHPFFVVLIILLTLSFLHTSFSAEKFCWEEQCFSISKFSMLLLFCHCFVIAYWDFETVRLLFLLYLEGWGIISLNVPKIPFPS